ncbi:MAG TPA: ATP-binding protein [Flavobacterium sp.]|uniref:sensor histidine kinase n=1 Tax=Flavobacterium sp. TaxID=239 RepID=UPI002B4B1846|nr:ATP-binding protein [Flavobacterium sp.]HLO73734.1 ATP-binding protein [Flavobacterium sp.]
MKSEIKVTLQYIFIGLLWIFVSDELLLIFMSKNDLDAITHFQNIKGTFYILSTALLLYLILKRHNDAIKQKMNQLKKNAQELEITNQELEKYINLASHDLQEPARTVTSFLTHIEKKYTPVLDEKGKNYIHFAVEGAYKMRRIILDLLEYSKINKVVVFEKVNIHNIIYTIEEQFKAQEINKNITINYQNLPVITSDRELIFIVFKNLIDNAIKFKKSNTPLTITIEAIDFKNKWLFKVSDNGIGIEEEYFDKIFILFQKLNNNSSDVGTGAGLAIAKKIISNLNGKIWVESKINMGSNFYIKLPKS